MPYLYIEKFSIKTDGKENMGNIKNLPASERPYEKMLMYGEEALTNSELLSIIIKTGTKEKSSIEIAQELLNKNMNNSNNFRFLQTASIDELVSVNGIGTVKAIELKAVGEVAKRISKPFEINKLKIKTREDVAKIFMEELQNEQNEILKIVMLDNKNIIKKISCIAVGNEKNIFTNTRAILSEPVKNQIPKIILVHNHPSGNPEPSKEDIEFTNKVYKAAKLLDIELLDHIIIGEGIYDGIEIK